MIIFNVHICNIVIIGMITNIINCHFYLRLWSLFTNGILVEKCSSASTRERESDHFNTFISIPSNHELVEEIVSDCLIKLWKMTFSDCWMQTGKNAQIKKQNIHEYRFMMWWVITAMADGEVIKLQRYSAGSVLMRISYSRLFNGWQHNITRWSTNTDMALL